MLGRITNLFRNLVVYPDRMRANMALTCGLYHSEAVLLSLVRKGLTRQEAYKITQRIAMACFRDHLDFPKALREDAKLRTYLKEEEIAAITDETHYFAHVEAIFRRVFG
jgi:adenylosuccinate lyase